ncbi:hypothetical protein [Burkholderia glumae]
MSKLKIVLGVAALAAVSATSAAQAARVGVYIGPGWGGYWYPPPVYYAPPPVVAVPLDPGPPPEYVEQGAPPAEAAGTPPLDPGSWYYCSASKRYYPYVKTCPSGWREVPARPQ